MKRYSITYVSKKDGVVVDISETPDGEFVRYEDCMKALGDIDKGHVGERGKIKISLGVAIDLLQALHKRI